ncbi:MAG: hypothetical protein QXQ73_03105 [Desulfurococcaceae archaeon]
MDKLAEAYAEAFTEVFSRILRYLVEAYKRFLADQADALALITLAEALKSSWTRTAEQGEMDYWGE